MQLPSGILLVDKPKGITSFDVIRRLRREMHINKMGHAGTLDPLATGLMIVGVGSSTKHLTDYIQLPKEYVAEIRIGEKRSTGDMEGVILEKSVVACLDEREVVLVLKNMRGTHTLPVSAYSAIKKDGVPMYTRARKAEKEGKMVTDVPIRDMEVLDVEFLVLTQYTDYAVVTVRFEVGSGTYIRSLGEEVGRLLGYPATLQNLRRTKIGGFRVEDARTIET